MYGSFSIAIASQRAASSHCGKSSFFSTTVRDGSCNFAGFPSEHYMEEDYQVWRKELRCIV